MLTHGLIMYIVAFIILEGTLTKCGDRGDSVGVDPDLCRHFGSFGAAFLSLCKALYGGEAWGDYMALLSYLGSFYPALLLVFIMFYINFFANVVVAAMVILATEAVESQQSILLKRELKKKEALTCDLQELFVDLDVNSSGGLSLPELQLAVRNKKVASLLSTLDISKEDIE